MNKVYVVRASGGSYEDAFDTPIVATTSEACAKELCDKLAQYHKLKVAFDKRLTDAELKFRDNNFIVPPELKEVAKYFEQGGIYTDAYFDYYELEVV